MKLKNKLKRAIERSNAAYLAYSEQKKYFMACRIYNANIQLYDFLESYLYEEDVLDEKEVFEYLFHLEDWFNQFDATVEKQQPQLEDRFVFERLDGSYAYPTSFLDNLKIIS